MEHQHQVTAPQQTQLGLTAILEQVISKICDPRVARSICMHNGHQTLTQSPLMHQICGKNMAVLLQVHLRIFRIMLMIMGKSLQVVR